MTALFAAMPESALGQTGNSDQTQIYAPDYFTIFQPQTAADMVDRLPGFTVQGGEGGERGFGQASLNVLINGRRPSSKSSDANEILRRIPASNVTSIEILDGASLDIPGLSGQVANVITKSTKLSGSWEYAARFQEGTQPQLTEAQISLSGERGNLSFVGSIRHDPFFFTEDGVEQYFNGDLELIEDRIEDTYFYFSLPSANLNLTWTPKVDHIVNLNLSGQLRNRSNGIRESFTAVTAEGQNGSSEISAGEDEYNYEIGGDYSFPALDGTLKFIGLYRFEESDFNQLFLNRPLGEIPRRQVFDQLDHETEAILRAEYSFKPGVNHDIQWSVEGALNSLESDSVFSFTGGTSEILDNVRVEEDRAETNVTHSWAVSDKFTLQSSAGIEYSKIDVVTSGEPSDDFLRPKGFISASYDLNPTYTWRAKIEREVGQLNFGTYVSGVNLGNDTRTAAGRTVPEQSWLGEIELERKDSTGLSGTIKLFGEIIENPIERVLFDNGTPNDRSDDLDGPANLNSSAYRYGVSGNATWLLDGLGFKGGRFTFDGELGDSNLDDPITGETRQINTNLEYRYEMVLRQDIPQTDYAWFVYLEDDENSPFYRLDQLFDDGRDRPELRLGFEHKNLFGMKAEFRLDNILNWKLKRERPIFTPDRAGELEQLHIFNRRRGLRFSIVLSDTF